MKPRIIIVDDEPSLLYSLKKMMESKGYETFCASHIEEAEKAPFLPDVALVDLNLPDGQGTDYIEKLREKDSSVQGILITGETSINVTVVQAIKKDIIYFIKKPFEPELIFQMIQKALKQKEILNQNKNLKNNIKKQYQFDKIIGQSEDILKITEMMKKIANSPSTLLITGESGTGKELIARSIHCAHNSSAPFVSVNCGAIPKELMESEFFGHVKGAFTGAIHRKKGRFEMAYGGTLFLDEIGAMDLNLQVKLLRVLQEKEFEPVGSCQPIPCNARIIAATNINLEKAVEEKVFRNDLYYRLNIIPIQISPLRERVEDIPLLLKHFIRFFNQQRSKNITGVSKEALECLCQHAWPGNIREMENLIERLSVLKEEGTIETKDLPEKYLRSKKTSTLNKFTFPEGGMDFNETISQYESSILKKALEKTKWNRKQAADLLKLNRTTLVEKIKKKGLKPNEL